MINKTVTLLILLSVVFLFSCSKKEAANVKFIGSYSVKDTWGSSKVGSGTLDYNITMDASGEDAVLINNVQKTLDGVKAKISGDTLFIQKQTLKSKSGKSYDVDTVSAVLKNNTLEFSFGYSDLNYDNGIGYVYAGITANKDVKK